MTTWRTYSYSGTTTFTWTLIHGETITVVVPTGGAPLEDRHTALGVDYVWRDGTMFGWLIRWLDGTERRIDKVSVDSFEGVADIREGEPVEA